MPMQDIFVVNRVYRVIKFVEFLGSIESVRLKDISYMLRKGRRGCYYLVSGSGRTSLIR
jgi:hypothetical protein